MVQNVETQASVSGQSLVGRRVYSPAALAAYTVLSSLPVGLVLYGLNLKARGQRRLGFWMACFGIASLSLLELLSFREKIPVSLGSVFAFFGAINIHSLEKGPFERALRHGAVRARWWPPALVLLVVWILLLAVELVFADVHF